MKIYFTKMQGLGNDFMVIDGVRQHFEPTPELVIQWANRKTGIGFDQLLLVQARKNKKVDYLFRIFNADGGEVAQCGNGARCLAKFLQDNKLIDRDVMRVETLEGVLELQVKDDGEVTVEMGRPIIKKNPPALRALPYFKGDDQSGLVLSLGNPHCVFQVEDVNTAAVQEIGSLLNNAHPAFPSGVNVGFMQVINQQQIKLRVYERGVGETLACGSGACAAVVAGRTLNLLDAQVTVAQSGGKATVSWAGDNSSVSLTGPATTVFNGEVEI